MAWNGKYELVSDEGMLEHMLAAGLPENFAQALLKEHPFELAVDDKEVVYTSPNGPVKYAIDAETVEMRPNGDLVKHFVTVEDDKMTLNIDMPEGKWKRTFLLSGSELTFICSSLKDGVPDGKRVFKKV